MSDLRFPPACVWDRCLSLTCVVPLLLRSDATSRLAPCDPTTHRPDLGSIVNAIRCLSVIRSDEEVQVSAEGRGSEGLVAEWT